MQLPAGIKILSVAETSDKSTDAAAKILTSYIISFERELSAEDRNTLKSFMASDSFSITKNRKGRPRRLDIRKQVKSIDISRNNELEMVLLNEGGKAAGKPAEILKAAFNLTDEEVLDMKILKVWSKSEVQ
jgi:hypothetical protein